MHLLMCKIMVVLIKEKLGFFVFLNIRRRIVDLVILFLLLYSSAGGKSKEPESAMQIILNSFFHNSRSLDFGLN